ncbi:MAG: VOC family protein [Anaerolineae bacterium]
MTITVSDLERSRRFYKHVAGFEPQRYYKPARWPSYRFADRACFTIGDVPGYEKAESRDIANFDVWGIEESWNRIKDDVEIEEELTTTPWGSHTFVIRDPNGHRLGFAEKRSQT